jgi:Helix-turn-helix domain
MGSRHPNPRLAKIHRNYSVEDVSRLFSIHKNTVRNWLREGLKPIDDQRPTLIQGSELRRFLTERRARSKQTSGPGRLYCLPCRAPKVPAGKIADCIQTGDTSGTLQGICPECNRMIYRRVNPQKLNGVRGDLEITVTQARTRIEETSNPNVNCDSVGGDPQ